jgi:hypothetical protein
VSEEQKRIIELEEEYWLNEIEGNYGNFKEDKGG